MSRHPEWREALEYCGETCPAVDEAFDALIAEIEAVTGERHDAVAAAVWTCCQAVKNKGTLLLRDALVRACEDKQYAEGRAAEAEQEIESLRSEVAELKSEIRSLERELTEAA